MRIKRKNPTSTQYERFVTLNADVCCVCRERGKGVQLHHIDGNSSNTVDENLAVLCCSDHDAHHRPTCYSLAHGGELTKERILNAKIGWEHFIEEARQDNPNILASLTIYGSEDKLHA